MPECHKSFFSLFWSLLCDNCTNKPWRKLVFHFSSSLDHHRRETSLNKFSDSCSCPEGQSLCCIILVSLQRSHFHHRMMNKDTLGKITPLLWATWFLDLKGSECIAMLPNQFFFSNYWTGSIIFRTEEKREWMKPEGCVVICSLAEGAWVIPSSTTYFFTNTFFPFHQIIFPWTFINITSHSSHLFSYSSFFIPLFYSSCPTDNEPNIYHHHFNRSIEGDFSIRIHPVSIDCSSIKVEA